MIVNGLGDEAATVWASVMCQLHETTAWEVYAALSERRKASIAARLPAQKELKPIVKQELAAYLEELVSGTRAGHQRGRALLARLVGT